VPHSTQSKDKRSYKQKTPEFSGVLHHSKLEKMHYPGGPSTRASIFPVPMGAEGAMAGLKLVPDHS
jgi:hypothetical protein